MNQQFSVLVHTHTPHNDPLLLYGGVTPTLHGQAERQPEGHFHGSFCHGVMEAHVKLLRDGFQKHSPAAQTRDPQSELETHSC